MEYAQPHLTLIGSASGVVLRAHSHVNPAGEPGPIFTAFYDTVLSLESEW